MNPTNDPAVSITPEELAAIVLCKRPDRPSDTPPKAASGFRLPFESRLWYVAEFIHQARLKTRAGKLDVACSWRERAQDIAEEIASMVCHAPPDDRGKEIAPKLLRAVADALDGKHAPEPAETDQQRVLSAINNSYATTGQPPSNKELRELHISGRAIDEVLSNIRNANQGKGIKLRPERPGRKPKK